MCPILSTLNGLMMMMMIGLIVSTVKNSLVHSMRHHIPEPHRSKSRGAGEGDGSDAGHARGGGGQEGQVGVEECTVLDVWFLR